MGKTETKQVVCFDLAVCQLFARLQTKTLLTYKTVPAAVFHVHGHCELYLTLHKHVRTVACCLYQTLEQKS